MTDKWDNWLIYGGDFPGYDLPTVEYPISFEAVGEKGCYWYAGKLTHSDDCACDEDYDRSRDLEQLQ